MTEPSSLFEECGADRPPARGLVFVLTGPSGVGKDTVTNRLKAERFPLDFCVTVTTRRARPGEVHGVHYYFVSPEEFRRLLDSGCLLEHAVVHGSNYGIPLFRVREGLRKGQDIMITCDVQGAETLRRKIPNAIFIFLAPPTLEDLLPRLLRRGTESAEERALRLARAAEEMEHLPHFDYVVVNKNDELGETVEQVKAIVIAERCRVRRRDVVL
jgi:guanylate kinase